MAVCTRWSEKGDLALRRAQQKDRTRVPCQSMSASPRGSQLGSLTHSTETKGEWHCALNGTSIAVYDQRLQVGTAKV